MTSAGAVALVILNMIYLLMMTERSGEWGTGGCVVVQAHMCAWSIMPTAPMLHCSCLITAGSAWT